ncbi:hypothetical protein NUV25_34830 [Burkholderia pseudomultivorans]|uniref:hypothetical protein n=1 Tax=Burkholderia pseudomultivorans TaxID=1207504 RepID=UPI0028755A4D|nr:hypothetical protein [Burkholderia pseudomultivorans]MDS0862887.1 hypothetical protein [Burkholderia pseudomultivorans]
MFAYSRDDCNKQLPCQRRPPDTAATTASADACRPAPLALQTGFHRSLRSGNVDVTRSVRYVAWSARESNPRPRVPTAENTAATVSASGKTGERRPSIGTGTGGPKLKNTDAIALIVDPECGDRLSDIAATVRHAWIVTSPANDAAARRIRQRSPSPDEPDRTGGVTTFQRYGADRESWCAGILDTLDGHHNAFAQQPGYSVLQVYGVPFSERLRPALASSGFSTFTPTDDGFRACKRPSA